MRTGTKRYSHMNSLIFFTWIPLKEQRSFSKNPRKNCCNQWIGSWLGYRGTSNNARDMANCRRTWTFQYCSYDKKNNCSNRYLPPLGNMEGFQTQWPEETFAISSVRISLIISLNYGEEVWTHWNYEYGEEIPYLLPSKRVFGQNLHPLYLEWKESFFDRYNEQIVEIREEGESVFEIISPKEQNAWVQVSLQMVENLSLLAQISTKEQISIFPIRWKSCRN